ncbi:MAG: CDP-alcohol phosphatidyltransferase family protein [Bryobacteraceae bacterium]
MKRALPNLLTSLRLVAAPYVFYLMLKGRYSELIPLFIAIAITDALDGYLARLWNVPSRIGAFLDPIADKLLLSGSFLFLALSGGIQTWIALIVLSRDVGILLGALVLYLRGKLHDFPPSTTGKISSFTQILFICFQVGALSGIAVQPVAAILQWAVAAMAVISAADYGRRMWSDPQ